MLIRRPNPDFPAGTRVSEGSRVGVVAETTPGTRAAGMVDVVFEGGYGGPERRRASGLKRVNGVGSKMRPNPRQTGPIVLRFMPHPTIATWIGAGQQSTVFAGMRKKLGPLYDTSKGKNVYGQWIAEYPVTIASLVTGKGLHAVSISVPEAAAGRITGDDVAYEQYRVAKRWFENMDRLVQKEWMSHTGYIPMDDVTVSSRENPGKRHAENTLAARRFRTLTEEDITLREQERREAALLVAGGVELNARGRAAIRRKPRTTKFHSASDFDDLKYNPLRNPRTAEGWEVYDPTREQFNATVQGVYESLAARDLRKPFYDARRNRADVKALASGAWTTDDVRRVLSKAFAIATAQGQKHGYLAPGTNAPTRKGAARSEARYAAAEAAHRVENRTDYETTLRLARKDQKTRVVVEGGKLVVPRAPIQLLTGNARRNPSAGEWHKSGNTLWRSRAGSGTWMVTKLSNGGYKLVCEDEGYDTDMEVETLGTFNTLQEVYNVIRSEEKPLADFHEAGFQMRRSEFFAQRAHRMRPRPNPIKSRTKQIGVVGTGNYLGGIKTGAPAESTPTTLYAVGPALDPDRVGYFVLTCSPFKKDVQRALSEIGGWTLLPNVTSTAYLNTLGVTVKRGGVVEQSAPAVHKVYKEATIKGARYTVVDARDISRGEFANKADAFEFAKIRDRKVAQLGLPQVHNVQKTAYGWEVYGPGFGETSEMEALKFDNAKRNEERTLLLDKLWKDVKAAEAAGQTQLAERIRHDRENIYLQAEWETDLFYDTEEKARRVAEKLDFRAASKGALPIKGFRTKAGIGGQKAEDIFNRTVALFDQKRVHYVLDRSVVASELSPEEEKRAHAAKQRAREAKLREKSVDTLRGAATRQGEDAKKLAAIEDEAHLRGRKTLINKILKIVDRQAEQKLLDYAGGVWGASKLAAVLAEERSAAGRSATMPGAFNVAARAFGEDQKRGFRMEASTWEHLAGRLWPKGGIPTQFFPVFTFKTLSEWSDDTLRVLAKKCGYSDAQITKFMAGAEVSALSKIVAETALPPGARSVREQIRMGKIEHDIPLAQRIAMERQRAGTARVFGGKVKPMRAPRDTSRAPLPPVDRKAAEILKQARQPVAPSYVGLPQLPKPVPVEESVLAPVHVAATESREERNARITAEMARLDAQIAREKAAQPQVIAGTPTEAKLVRDIREAARALAEADSKKSNPRHRRTA